jgi:cytochrome c peroxidase
MKTQLIAGLAIAAVIGFLACAEREEERPILTETQLGEKLFFEKALSRDSTISCGTCICFCG